MFNQFFTRTFIYFVAVGFLFAFASCTGSRKAHKELLYLQGNLDTMPNLKVPPKEVTFQKGDLLSIVVYSDNPEATVIFNQQQFVPGSSNSSASTGPTVAGYLVDENGNIHFQSLGTIHVEGLTKAQLQQQLSERLSTYLKNPYVTIRFLNFRFTVIGEVTKPGTYTVPQEKVSILEMLGLAGDMTFYGRRDNILVIREKNGERQFGRLDLRRSDIFQSPYFYLQQNDVVLIEANPKKTTANDQATLRKLSIVTGIASLVSATAIIINIFR